MPNSNANDKVLDGVTTHSINLLRVAAGQRTKVLAMLEDLGIDLASDIAKGASKPDRLAALLKQTKGTIQTAYAAIKANNGAALAKIAHLEATKTVNVINGAIGVPLATVGQTPEQLAAIAGKTLIGGKYPAEWWDAQDANLRDRFAAQMRQGMLRGESVDDLVKRVRGSKAAGYTDGLMLASKRQAEALVRTSVIATANEARIKTLEANQDVNKGIQWVATLDSRTTPQCRALDGKQWTLPDYKPVGHDKAFPGPTAHWNCRSTQIGVLRSWAELAGPNSKLKDGDGKPADIGDLLAAKLEKMGMGAEQIAKAKLSTRASMDGQVARELDFDGWLKTKGDAFADDLLGPGRAKLWRDGKVTIAEMTDQNSRPLSLGELQDMIAKNTDVVAPKDGEGGLMLTERKLLEAAMRAGVENEAVTTTYIDTDTGESVTVGLTVTNDQLAKLKTAANLTVISNSLAAGEVWDAIELQLYAQLPGFRKAMKVGPTGKVVTLTAKPGALNPVSVAELMTNFEALKNTKTIPQTQHKMVSAASKVAGLQVKVSTADAVKLPKGTFLQTFPAGEKPAPFFDPKKALADEQAKTTAAAKAKQAALLEKEQAAAATIEDAYGKFDPVSTALVEIANDPDNADLSAVEMVRLAQSTTAAVAKKQAQNKVVADAEAKADAAAAQRQAAIELESAQAATRVKLEADATAANVAKVKAQAEAKAAAAEAAKLVAAKQQANTEAAAEIYAAIGDPTGKKLLVKNILKLTKEQPGMEPADTLALAKEMALKDQASASQAAALSGYKAKVLEGKEPTPAQIKALQALPPEKQNTFLTGVQTAKEKLAIEAAQKLAAEQQAAAALAAEKQAAADAAAKAQAAAAAAAQAAMKPKPVKKKKPVAAEPVDPTAPTPAMAPVNEALFPITPAMTKPVPGVTLGGSTGARLVQDDKGNRFVLKKGANAGHILDEMTADRAYAVLGAMVPDGRLYTTTGGPVKLTRYLENAKTLPDYLATATPAQAAAVREQLRSHFVADALLANYDVIGLAGDNVLVTPDGTAYRADNGGSLRYRAQGAKKDVFFADPQEIDTMRNPAINPKAAEMFGGISDAEIARQVRAIEARRAEFLAVMPDDLRQVMSDRLDALAKRFGVAATPPEPETRPSALPSTIGATVRKARLNGVAVLGDGGDVEDLHTLVWEEKDASGQQVTRLQMKLTFEGSQKLVTTIGDSVLRAAPPEPGIALVSSAATTPSSNVHPKDAFWEQLKAAAKTTTTHASDGNYNATTMANFAQAKAQLTALQSDKSLDAQGAAMVKTYGEMVATIEAAQKAKAAMPKMFQQFTYDPKKAPKAKATPAPVPAGMQVFKTDKAYKAKVIDKGHGQETNGLAANPTTNNKTEAYRINFGPDVSIRFIRPTGQLSGEAMALQGKVEITVRQTASVSAIERAHEAMRELGIDLTPPTAEQRELVYLRRGVYVAKKKNVPAFDAIVNSAEPAAERIKKAKAWIAQQLGVKLPDRPTKDYNPDGEANSFGEGHRSWYRWDMPREKVEKEMAGFVMTHNIGGRDVAQFVDAILNSGGELTPTTQRMRKGVNVSQTGGMSSGMDVQTGGASYFFLRIARNTEKFSNIRVKIRNLARQDAISYDGDRFGAVNSIGDRKVTPAEWKAHCIATGNHGPETILKNGLSFIDEIEAVNVSSATERTQVLAIFKKHGLSRLPDGRAIEDVVRIR